MQQLTSGTRCCCRGAAPGGDFLLLLEKDFFGKLDRCTIFILFEEEFFGKPGSRVMPCFFLQKNAAINLRNALLLSCRGWGPFFLLEKEFFWKAGPKWIDAQFFFGLKKNFLESPGRGSCVGLFSFF